MTASPGSAPRARFEVRVSPRASREGVEGWREGVLVVRLTAPPVEGAANQALVKVLSKALKVPRRSVSLLLGDRSRNKVVEVEGMTLEEVRGALAR